MCTAYGLLSVFFIHSPCRGSHISKQIVVFDVNVYFHFIFIVSSLSLDIVNVWRVCIQWSRFDAEFIKQN